MAITIIGDAFIDIALPIHGIQRGETHDRDMRVSFGGTANVAIQLSASGEEARFVGKVGNDGFGLQFKENLRRNKVKDLTSLDNDIPTGLCVSLVYEDGERSMVVSRGANDYLVRSDVESYLYEIKKSKAVYFSGYSLLNMRETTLYLMKKLYRDIELWFNPGAPNIITGSFREVIRDFIDVLILNLDEAKSITKVSDIEEILADLKEIVGLSVITLGEEGCIVTEGENSIHVPVDTILRGVDTTGAGDAFSAGFLMGRSTGVDAVAGARLGHEVAMDFLEGRASIL